MAYWWLEAHGACVPFADSGDGSRRRAGQTDVEAESPLPDDPRNFWTLNYGLTNHGDLFTPRQFVALTTFSDLVGEARKRILQMPLPPDSPATPEGRSRGHRGSSVR